MRIWLLNGWEPLPSDGAQLRLMRTGLLARLLIRLGHDVLWWSSTVDHYRKRLRADCSVRFETEPHLPTWCLHGRLYRRNISLARLVSHAEVGAEFRRLARTEPCPDVIFASMPTIELAYEATRYGRRHGVPVVVDIRDMWPDIWLEAAPWPLRGVAHTAMIPWKAKLRSALNGATAICGFTEAAIDWALAKVGRERTKDDRVFPFAYETEPPPASSLAAAERFWDEQGLDASRQFIACYIGSLSKRVRGNLLIEAAACVPAAERSQLRFVICGEGETRLDLVARSRGLDHVLLPGWIDRAQIWVLLRRASAGLLPYPRTLDFIRSVPNKAIEYISASRPIITSLHGEVASLIARYDCGIAIREDTPQAFAETLLHLKNHTTECARLAQGARRAFTNFGADQVYGRLAAHLESIALVAR